MIKQIHIAIFPRGDKGTATFGDKAELTVRCQNVGDDMSTESHMEITRRELADHLRRLAISIEQGS